MPQYPLLFNDREEREKEEEGERKEGVMEEMRIRTLRDGKKEATNVHKHVACLLLWVRTHASECIRTNSFVLVCPQPYGSP